jgi:cyclopropane-fatty-acyl-phospholipid synthase
MASPAPLRTLADTLRDRAPSLPFSLTIRQPDGGVVRLGNGSPSIEISILSPGGLRALRSLSELEISEAYIRGDLDIDGDLLDAMALRDALVDRKPWIRIWARLLPAVIGRTRCNPSWIAKHYDAGNVQLLAADADHQTYTPGIYERDDDSLELGAERKLEFAFESLQLAPGDRVLDVGCGWGGFLRYCARRGVHATGITLSHDQHRYATDRGRPSGATGSVEVLYQDFFSYAPARRYDGISLMGVIEDLSDYGRVMERVARWLTPQGRVYCDFAAAPRRFTTSSFVTRHIWPGTFRMVYMPEFMQALDRTSLDIVELHNDRRNYFLWCRELHRRWLTSRDEVVAMADEATWRTFRLLFAGVASIMGPSSQRATAYRLVLSSRMAVTALRTAPVLEAAMR